MAVTTPASGENLALARQLFSSFAQRDVVALAELLHPDVSARPSITGGPTLEGREATLEWLERVERAGGAVEARPLDYEAQGNCVVVRGYLRHKEGRMLCERPAYWLYEIRDQLIVRMESHPTRGAALASCDCDN